MRDWKNFHEITKNKPPRKNIIYFIERYHKYGNVIDLGCGSGSDTVFLIKNNWNVFAIDSSDVEEIIRSKLSDEEQGKLKFEVQRFEKLKLSKCDLLISNNSLPFCKKEYFNKMWKEICLNINSNGYFVGNFFGIKDEWNTIDDKRTFHSKEEVIKLFKDFEILEIQEIEKNKPTAEGKMKHWNTIEVIARKI